MVACLGQDFGWCSLGGMRGAPGFAVASAPCWLGGDDWNRHWPALRNVSPAVVALAQRGSGCATADVCAGARHFPGGVLGQALESRVHQFGWATCLPSCCKKGRRRTRNFACVPRVGTVARAGYFAPGTRRLRIADSILSDSRDWPVLRTHACCEAICFGTRLARLVVHG